MELTTGARLRSQVGPTELIVVRPSAGDVDLQCGGHPMVTLDTEPAAGLEIAAGLEEGAQIGKRYTDAAGELELLVTKAGPGTLTIDGVPVQLKEAKPLPASD